MIEIKVHRFITTDELFPEANAGVLYYEKSEADMVIAEKDAEIARLKAKLAEKDKEIARQNEAWNRLCKKYNKFVSLKQEFCEKFKDIELEITK